MEATPNRPTETAIADSPARLLPGEADAPPSGGVGLCLSGGGYRAMLFHLGALWRLNEASWLRRLDRSRASLAARSSAGVLALAWDRLGFEGDVATNFIEAVVERGAKPRRSCTIDISAVLRGTLGPGSIAERAAAAYREHLFGRATLQDLPAEGEGGRVRLQRHQRPERGPVALLQDLHGGLARRPDRRPHDRARERGRSLGRLSPVLAADAGSERGEVDHRAGQSASPTATIAAEAVLSDGGVYDNLGLGRRGNGATRS